MRSQRVFSRKRPFRVATLRKNFCKALRATVMALVVEIVQVADKVYAVTTHQIAEEEGDSDWDALQRVADTNAQDALERIEVRELLQVLLERTPLAPREREVINLILEGEDNFSEIAKRLGLTRSRVWGAFRSAVQKLRRSAEALGIAP
jgi:DNA-directed RNA polymerase specialized sigma subunit